MNDAATLITAISGLLLATSGLLVAVRALIAIFRRERPRAAKAGARQLGAKLMAAAADGKLDADEIGEIADLVTGEQGEDAP